MLWTTRQVSSFHTHLVLVSLTACARVFDGYTAYSDPMKTFSKFHGPVFGAKYRADGKLLVCGGDEGRVRVFDDSTRSMLKQFKGHVGAVRCTLFAPNKTSIMSGGDDGSLRGWDMPTGSQLFSSALHTEQIRSGAIGQAAPDVWLSGGYDKKVSAFDIRNQSVAYALSLTDPVECVRFVDTCLFAVANGPNVSLFDLRSISSPVVVLSNHAKTVTCLDVCENGSKLLSGSADQTVKLWDLHESRFQCVLTKRFAQPVLCMGIAPVDESFFVVGMADGKRRHTFCQPRKLTSRAMCFFPSSFSPFFLKEQSRWSCDRLTKRLTTKILIWRSAVARRRSALSQPRTHVTSTAGPTHSLGLMMCVWHLHISAPANRSWTIWCASTSTRRLWTWL